MATVDLALLAYAAGDNNLRRRLEADKARAVATMAASSDPVQIHRAQGVYAHIEKLLADFEAAKGR